MTLPELEALEDRRMVAVRHARFNAALSASAVYNAHRGEDTDPLSPFDFLPGFERDPEEVEAEKSRKAVKQAVGVAFAEMKGATAEQVRAEKVRMIERMKANGIEDAEELIREVYPDI